jgi:alpha/beta superfamily hydrolase
MSPALGPTPFAVETIAFAAGPYCLEGWLAYPEAGRPRAATVIAGPQPLLGGSLDNNVVRALGDGLAERGLLTLRFNYRGVGRSDGPPVAVTSNLAEFWRTSHLADELDWRHDLEGALAYVRQVGGDAPLVLIGYSFGCALLPLVSAAGPRVLIAPTLGKHDYSPYLARTDPMLVIASDDDFAAPSAALAAWFGALRGQKKLLRGGFDNHFFRGHEGEVLAAVLDFINDYAGR